MTAGQITAGIARERLQPLLDDLDTTVEDRWALTAAGQDLLTPALDALTQAPFGSQQPTNAGLRARLSDVAGTRSHRPHLMMRPALWRMTYSRLLAGSMPDAPALGLWHSDYHS